MANWADIIPHIAQIDSFLLNNALVPPVILHVRAAFSASYWLKFRSTKNGRVALCVIKQGVVSGIEPLAPNKCVLHAHSDPMPEMEEFIEQTCKLAGYAGKMVDVQSPPRALILVRFL